MTETTIDIKNYQDRLTTLAATKGFIGREFLTWLWYQSETSGDKITAGSSPLIGPLTSSFWIDDRIVLQPLDHVGHEHLMRGGTPSHSAEAATALSTGKLVKEIKLGVHIEGLGEFTAVLSYHDLSPRSLQLPPPGVEGQEASALLAARVQQTQCFLQVLDSLFALFMQVRTDPAWETKGLEQIRQWMKSRLSKRARTIH